MHRAHSRLRSRSAGTSSPMGLFTQGEEGLWLDPSDMATMFQDDAGTVPVTADGQSVGRILDKSGRGHHATQAVAGSRPILRTAGGLWYLEFDGVDDFLVTGSINLTATDKVSTFSGIRKALDTPTGMFAELSTDGSANNGTFALTAPTSSVPGSYGFNLRGTVQIARAASVFTAPITNVVACAFDIGAADFNTEVLPRVNGLVPTLSGAGASGTGNFGTYPLYIGRRGGTTLPFNGFLYGLIVRGAATGADAFSDMEQYMGSKSGISIT